MKHLRHYDMHLPSSDLTIVPLLSSSPVT